MRQMATSPNEPGWTARVITLNKDSERYARFAAHNSTIDFQPFLGIQGSEISNSERVRTNLATQELVDSGQLTDGGVGCGASHRALWREAAEKKIGMLILEDDVVAHPQLTTFIDKNLDFLLRTDITLFTVNTDSFLETISPEGVHSLQIFSHKHPSYEWIKATLKRTSLKSINAHRLLACFGRAAYFLSPSGARIMEENTFPLSLDRMKMSLKNFEISAKSVDRKGNFFYRKINAAITIPFLAYTPNDDSTTKKINEGSAA
jgi:GR25 family glycosyltransferase involved in LPS biosynthesis